MPIFVSTEPVTDCCLLVVVTGPSNPISTTKSATNVVLGSATVIYRLENGLQAEKTARELFGKSLQALLDERVAKMAVMLESEERERTREVCQRKWARFYLHVHFCYHFPPVPHIILVNFMCRWTYSVAGCAFWRTETNSWN